MDQISGIEKNISDLRQGSAAIPIISEENSVIQEIKTKLTDLENRSRRDNLRFDGFSDADETWEESEARLKTFINELGLNSNDIEIERAHRIGKFKGVNNNPRTIIAKFLKFKDKQSVLKAAKMRKINNIYVNEDYAEETMAIRKKLFPEVKRLREQEKYATVVVERLVVREMNQ